MEQNAIKKVTKKVVASLMSGTPYEWPPSCLIFAYQPVRPEKNAQCENLGAYKAKEEK